MQENLDQEAALEAQVQTLRAQVAALRGQLDRDRGTGPFRARMQDALLTLSGEAGVEEVKVAEEERLRTEVEEMEEDLSRQSALSGFSISSCSAQTVASSGGGVVLQYSLAGSCSELLFQAQFRLSEVKGQQRRISDLNIVLTADCPQLRSFVSRVEQSLDLLLLFRTLCSFSLRSKERRTTFQHFQEKYPSIVSLPGGCRSEVMNLHNPQLPGCALVLSWSLEVSIGGAVTPHIHLLTKIPETALQMDSAGAVGESAESFRSLQRLVGTEAAVESLILALSEY